MSQGPQAVQAPIKVEFQNQTNVGGELKKKESKNKGAIKYAEHIHRRNTTCVYTCKHVHINIHVYTHINIDTDTPSWNVFATAFQFYL